MDYRLIPFTADWSIVDEPVVWKTRSRSAGAIYLSTEAINPTVQLMRNNRYYLTARCVPGFIQLIIRFFSLSFSRVIYRGWSLIKNRSIFLSANMVNLLLSFNSTLLIKYPIGYFHQMRKPKLNLWSWEK